MPNREDIPVEPAGSTPKPATGLELEGLPGRLQPPTDEEVLAAEAVGGLWVGTRRRPITLSEGPHPRMTLGIMDSRGNHGHAFDFGQGCAQWFYIRPDGRMSAGP